jgi:hypothetical protein
MKMNWKAIFGFVAVAVVSLVLVGHVQAAPATSIWFSGEQNQSSDNDAEFLVNQLDGAGMPTADTTLDTGDVLVSVSNFFSNEDITGLGGTKLYGAGGVNELTILSLIEVAFKGNLATGVAGASVGVDGAGNLLFDYVFSPLTAGGVAALGAHASLAAISAEQATWTAGTLVALFDDPLIDYTRLASPDDGGSLADIGVGPFVTEAGLVGTAINGTKILEIGFTGVAGEAWLALAAPDDLSLFRTLVAAGSASGVFNFGTNVTASFLGPLWQFGTVLNSAVIGGSSQFAGSGSLLGLNLGGGTSIGTPFDAFTNLDVTFAPTFVPEPSTLTLWSLGVLALAGIGWRRRNRVR